MTFIPWSCKESFTPDNCGLPGAYRGCWRHRQIASHSSIALNPDFNPGIAPRCDLTGISDWIVFSRSVDGKLFQATYIRDLSILQAAPPNLSKNYQILFGFMGEGLSIRPVPASDIISYRCDGIERKVTNWDSSESTTSASGSDQALSEWFDRDTFRPIAIQGLDLSLSISDLLNAYMDRHCAFRRRGVVGISQCKVEMEFSKSCPPNSRVVTFSYVAPLTSQVEQFPDLFIGAEKLLTPKSVRQAIQHCRRLEISPAGIHNPAEIVFPDCFTHYGRYHILPEEVDSSLLRFPVGEIDAYLLHWFLLRIASNEQNLRFLHLFHAWGKALNSDSTQRKKIFGRLLDEKVILENDGNIFDNIVLRTIPPKDLETYLGIYLYPRPFRDVLTTLELSDNNDRQTARATLAFLKNFWQESAQEHRFSKLPMYKDLNWKQSPLLDVTAENDWESVIECILSSFVGAAGLSEHSEPHVLASNELSRHVRRSVFPMGHILTHWPCNIGVAHYFILPLWEDKIQDELRPVIFAHVFAADITAEGAKDKGLEMQKQLRPMGEAIAHSLYDLTRTGWSQADADIKLVGVLAHMAGNRLRLINFDPAQRMAQKLKDLSHGQMLTSLFHEKDIDSVLESLELGTAGLDEAMCLIGINELSAVGGTLRDKFLAKKEYDLASCLNRSIHMLESMVLLDTRTRHMDPRDATFAKIRLKIKPEVSSMLETIVFPEGYLLRTYVETFLYEILSNSSKHGRRRRNGNAVEVIVQVNLSFRDSTAVISLVNPLNRAAAEHNWILEGDVTIPSYRIAYGYRRHSFLSLARELTRKIPGIRFQSSVLKTDKSDDHFYETIIELGPLTVESRAEKVSPVCLSTLPVS